MANQIDIKQVRDLQVPSRTTLWTGSLTNTNDATITLSETVAHFDAIEFMYGLFDWNVSSDTGDCATVVTLNPSRSNRMMSFLTLIYGYNRGSQEIRSGVVQVSENDGVTLNWDVPRSTKTAFTGATATTSAANASDNSSKLTLVRVTGIKYS